MQRGCVSLRHHTMRERTQQATADRKNQIEHVLIVDDIAFFARAIKDFLRKRTRLRIDIATSLEEAEERMRYAKVQGHPYQLVICDLQLGCDCGYDVLEMAKKQWPRVRTVIMSSTADTDSTPDSQSDAKLHKNTTNMMRSLLTIIENLGMRIDFRQMLPLVEAS